MNPFEYTDRLTEVFTGDKKLRDLLDAGEPSESRAFAMKFRRKDQEFDEFEPSDLSFIAFYFVDTDSTKNSLVNKGLLRIEIYAKRRSIAAEIRHRIVELMHNEFDERVVAEGQKVSGIKEVFKYRLEFRPLVFN